MPSKLPEDLIKALQQPFYVNDQELYIRASIGISIYPEHAQSASEMLRNADVAMYKVKNQGKNNYQMFETQMNDLEQRRLWLITHLHKALEFGELVLYYQPQLELSSNRLVGAEALIRWMHPELGLISPGEFIPVAEETGLIVSVGTWVLNEACCQAKEWQQRGLPPVRISVNVSALQFGRSDFVEIVEEVLLHNQLDPQWLELELTEGLLLNDITETVKKLNRLKSLGLSLAIDDFGTGYSSLRYLQQLPINTLKIDQSFVCRLELDSEDSSKHKTLIDVIANLAHNLNMCVIAEGVETELQKKYLDEIGCEQIQGYLYSRPLSTTNFEQFLEKQPPL